MRPNSRALARRNISEHYDLSNDFFSLFLDPSMMYSAAKWSREGLTLGLPVETVECIFTLGFALEQLRLNLGDLERCVRENARKTGMG